MSKKESNPPPPRMPVTGINEGANFNLPPSPFNETLKTKSMPFTNKKIERLLHKLKTITELYPKDNEPDANSQTISLYNKLLYDLGEDICYELMKIPDIYNDSAMINMVRIINEEEGGIQYIPYTEIESFMYNKLLEIENFIREINPLFSIITMPPPPPPRRTHKEEECNSKETTYIMVEKLYEDTMIDNKIMICNDKNNAYYFIHHGIGKHSSKYPTREYAMQAYNERGINWLNNRKWCGPLKDHMNDKFKPGEF